MNNIDVEVAHSRKHAPTPKYDAKQRTQTHKSDQRDLDAVAEDEHNQQRVRREVIEEDVIADDDDDDDESLGEILDTVVIPVLQSVSYSTRMFHLIHGLSSAVYVIADSKSYHR